LRIEITSQASTEHKQGDKFSIHINIIRPPFESVCFGRVYKTSATCAIKPQPVFFISLCPIHLLCAGESNKFWLKERERESVVAYGIPTNPRGIYMCVHIFAEVLPDAHPRHPHSVPAHGLPNDVRPVQASAR